MIHCVFSSRLESDRHWYALSPTVCGIVPRRFASGKFFDVFTSEVKQVSIGELRTRDGDPAPASWFFDAQAPKARVDEVFVASTVGLLGGLFSRHGKSDAVCFPAIQSAIAAINKIDLESLPHTDGMPDDYEAQLHLSKATVAAIKHQLEVSEEKIGQLREKLRFYERTWSPNTDCAPKLLDASPPKPDASALDVSPPKPEEGLLPASPPNPGCPLSSSTPVSRSSESSCSSFPDGVESFEEIEASDWSPAVKRRKVRKKCAEVLGQLQNVCSSQKESLASVLAKCCLTEPRGKHCQAKQIIGAVVDIVVRDRGATNALHELISDDAWEKRIEAMRMPDWHYFLLKLEARISDEGWQNVLNQNHAQFLLYSSPN